MSLTHKTLLGLKWQAVEVGGRQLFGLVVFTTLARLLDPTAFGLIGMVGVYLALVNLFVEQGIGTALIQRKVIDDQHLTASFWFSLACALVVSGLTVSGAGTVAAMFAEPKLAPLLSWSSLSLIFGALGNTHSAIFIRNMDFCRPALRTLLANASGGITGVTMAIYGFGVWALVAQQLIAGLVGTIFMWAASTWRPSFAFSIRHLKELFGMSITMLATSALWFITIRIDQFVVGRFLGTSALGYYVVAGKLPVIMRTTVLQPIGAVTLPAMSILQDDSERLAQACYRCMRFVSVIGIPAFIGLAAVAPTAVPLIFGEQWIASIVPLQLLAIYSLTQCFQILFHPLLIALAMKRECLTVNLLNAVGAVLGCLIGIRFGVVGVVVGITISLNIVGILTFTIIAQRAQLSWIRFWNPCLLPTLASLLMLVAVYQIHTPMGGFGTLLIQIGVGAVVYGVTIHVLDQSRVSDVLALVVRTPITTSASKA